MSEIPESQWDELCKENQRLKKSLDWRQEQMKANPNSPIVLTGSTAFAVEIAVLKALCGRAAHALEYPGQLMQDKFRQLIAELRKAAE